MLYFAKKSEKGLEQLGRNQPFEGVKATSNWPNPSLRLLNSSPVPTPTTAIRTFGKPASLLKQD